MKEDGVNRLIFSCGCLLAPACATLLTRFNEELSIRAQERLGQESFS